MRKILWLLLFPLSLFSQQGFEAYRNYAFPTQLTVATQSNRIAWALDEHGKRNVFVAEGPDYKPRQLTAFFQDDGQEITSLSMTHDGEWVVFVRGGEHGSNWESGVPVNPTSAIQPFKVQIAAVPFKGGEIKYLAEADGPVISPANNTIAFSRGGQVYIMPADGSSPAKVLFTARGTIGSLQWSPDGRRLVFVSNRTDHSIIGLYTTDADTLQWIAPSFHRDQSPRWSPDGRKIVFIRTPGMGGPPDSLLSRRHSPWAIYTADISGGPESLLWRAPATLPGSVPNTHGGYNLHWAANDRIVFMSYMDGWPHLYSIPSSGGQPLLLTPGNFMCEHVRLSADRKTLLFSANAGPDALDIDRRHIAMVSTDKADMQVLTPGEGNEWSPAMLADGKSIALISSTAIRPPLPAILGLTDNKPLLLQEDKVPGTFPAAKMVKPSQVIFRAPDGVRVHATLFMPTGGGAKKPAIIYVHGGPPRQMLLGWHYSDYYAAAYAANQYLASQGFVVLSVNYRLGIGYGYDFHHPAAGGRSGAAEYQDIKAAGEWLKQQPYVDPGKIGIYGGSYGGFLTALALARDSDLFAAGVDIHGVHDWVTDRPMFATTEVRYEKAPDLEKAIEVAWQSSPVSSIHTWRSPVLIIHGDDDRNVRFNQSTDLIRRLEKQGVPHETMIVVDDTHHWMKYTNSVKVYQAMADFFKRKLL